MLNIGYNNLLKPENSPKIGTSIHYGGPLSALRPESLPLRHFTFFIATLFATSPTSHIKFVLSKVGIVPLWIQIRVPFNIGSRFADGKDKFVSSTVLSTSTFSPFYDVTCESKCRRYNYRLGNVIGPIFCLPVDFC